MLSGLGLVVDGEGRLVPVALSPSPIVSVCRQAAWSIGGVRERYMHCEKAGDKYTGRAATCLDVNAKEFAVLPPYWVEGEEVID